MLDFDDLDEAAPVPEAPPEFRGGFLKPVKRTEKLPGLQDHLPERLRKIFSDLTRRKVRLRLIAFYGAGDSFLSWAQFVQSAPDWVDVAVYEWPSHGLRADEPAAPSFDELAEDAVDALAHVFEEHATGGRFAGAPFAFIGHSLGARLLTLVAAQARSRYALEPKMVIVMDFPALHVPMFTEEGFRMLEENPVEAMELNNPMVLKASAAMSDGAKTLKMWQADLKLANDVRKPGFHLFNCHILVLVATGNFVQAFCWKDFEPEQREYYARRARCSASSPENSCDFDRERYDEWAKWTKGTCEVIELAENHMSIRMSPEAAKIIYEKLKLVRHHLEIGGSTEIDDILDKAAKS